MLTRVRRLFTPAPALPPSPVSARHAEPSMLYSADDDPGRSTPDLIDLAVRVIDRARRVDLSEVSARSPAASVRYPDVWPGEHYKLLAAATAVIAPRLVVEIGTAEGLSALTFRSHLPDGGRVVSFDIVPWSRYPGGVLTEADFGDGRLEQRLADLADPTAFAAHADLLRQADLVFVDAPKDARFEPAFLRNLDAVRFDYPPLVILDDIRVWNMLKLWREIDRPKLDLTSFGHWSGTGLVRWSSP